MPRSDLLLGTGRLLGAGVFFSGGRRAGLPRAGPLNQNSGQGGDKHSGTPPVYALLHLLREKALVYRVRRLGNSKNRYRDSRSDPKGTNCP